LSQLDAIFGAQNPPTPPPAAQQPPVQPPAPPDDSDNPDLLTHGRPAVVPALVPPAPPAEPLHFWVFTRERWLQWLLAVIGAIVGVVLARLFAGPLSRWLVPFNNGWTTFVAVLLWIGAVLGGFAIGGFIGLRILSRRRH
jgi:hypothetical protein